MVNKKRPAHVTSMNEAMADRVTSTAGRRKNKHLR